MSLPELSDQEKAAALDDLIHAYSEEWWDQDGVWLTIDGSAIVSDETARVLSLLMKAVRS
jgi:hypothetical protein